MRVLIFVLLLALVTACGNNADVPNDIIPGKKMETILWQLMQSDEYANIQLKKDSTKQYRAEKLKIYQQVFDLNGISMSEFKKSYQYYMSHPDITKVMFDSMTARAGTLRMELYKPKPALPAPVKMLDKANPVLNHK